MALLSDILGRLPVMVRNRYQDAGFWIPTANRILGEIEEIADSPEQIVEAYLLLNENFVEYPIPSTIRKVVRLRAVAAGDVSTHRVGVRAEYVPYRIIGSKIRLTDLPLLSDNDDITGTVAVVGSDGLIGSGVLATEADDTDAMMPRLLKLTHTTGGAIEYKIISDSDIVSDYDVDSTITGVTSQLVFTDSTLIGAGANYYKDFAITVTFGDGSIETRTISAFNTATGEITVSVAFTATLTTTLVYSIVAGIINPNSAFDSTPVKNDTFLITSNFYVVEGFKKLTRFTAVSDTVPIEQEFERVLADGLRYYGEIQTDHDSDGARVFYNEYDKSLKKYRNYHGTPLGDQCQVRPDDGWGSLQ